ncbi:MAG: NFYB/HAP3 family transcription factor subunit [Nanoarchaeota archaeon]|nr:NFYB/HAP3 family transcription factor subunit [Nanoarchaeota archaeon]
MRIPLNTVKRIMQDNMQNGKKPVSAKAIFLMAGKVEGFIVEKTRMAEEKLKEENNLRRIQGLKPKVRISEDLLKEVLKL